MNISQTAYCRLCADLKPHNKLLNLDKDVEKRQEIIKKLVHVNAKTDFNGNELPKTVCLVCFSSLERAYEFVTAIERAQVTLNNILLPQCVKKEDVESDAENIIYEEPEVKYEDDIETKIKVEVPECYNKPAPLSNRSKTSSKGKKKKNLPCYLDAIPLAQLKLTWSDYNWLCSFCGVQFPSVNELKEHSMQYHNRCNAYRCTDCNIRKLCLNKFLIHVKRHKKHLKLSCYQCFRQFSTPHKTNSHVKTHNKTEFVCSGCNTNFSNINELGDHVAVFYQDKKAREIPIQYIGLTCLICRKEYKNKTSLNTHLLTHTERSRDFICEICGKSFLSKQNLADHMINHNDARPHKCEICNNSFKTIKQLRNHVGVHDGGKPFSCEQCGRCFRLHRQLLSHRIIHTDSLPHICSYCNKAFRFKTILNQHIRQHTGVKPYSCTLCQRDFTNWPNYNKHMKLKHGTDMAKKKHTPNGVYPIDPKTGEIVYPKMEKMEEWKQKMMQPRRLGRKRMNGNVMEVVKPMETNNN